MNENVKTATRAPVMEARGIRKAFGQVQALRGAGFKARAGEVTALIGDNGAGKSSLVKVLSGVYTADEGELLIDGKPAGARRVPPGPGRTDVTACRHTHGPAIALRPRAIPYVLVGWSGMRPQRSGVVLGRLVRGSGLNPGLLRCMSEICRAEARHQAGCVVSELPRDSDPKVRSLAVVHSTGLLAAHHENDDNP
jgi:ABC-type cobalamin/Fe3+-siderophores transport system ATPase subunit